jgi:hypothetical protein
MKFWFVMFLLVAYVLSMHFLVGMWITNHIAAELLRVIGGLAAGPIFGSMLVIKTSTLSLSTRSQ